jgi:glycosyltransferase involved in cell wall biosynthesis
MNVTQISIGRFHHFHLARQLEKYNLLDSIWTGYPKFKLKDENGVPQEKIKTFPWFRTPYMMRSKIGLDRFDWLNKEWEWLAQDTLDRHVAKELKAPTILIALSATGLHAGKKAKSLGGHYICDRGSSHIRYQENILIEEYRQWGLKFHGIDPRVLEKEELEYHQADIITVPSEFVKSSFVEMGIPEHKIKKVVYGARLDRFKKTGEPPSDIFRIIWVGSICIRKGFMYLLTAFQKLKHPSKELLVVGDLTEEVKGLLRNQDLSGIRFLGQVQNSILPDLYSTSHVFVLPSIEEGLAMVQGEAMACGCPVIASINTGAQDLLTDRVEGFIIPIRSSEILQDRLQELSDNPLLRKEMSNKALQKVNSLGGWDTYGNQFKIVLDNILVAK